MNPLWITALLLVFLFVYVVVATKVHVAKSRRQLAKQGGFDALFGAFGFSPMDADEGTYAAVGRGERVVVKIDCATVEEFGEESTLTFYFDVEGLFPDDLSITSRLMYKEYSGWDRYFVDGHARDVLALQTTSFVEHAYRLLALSHMYGTAKLSISDGVLRLSSTDPTYLILPQDEHILGEILKALDTFERELSGRPSQAYELAMVLRLDDVEDTWSAARELCAHHAESDALATIVDGLGDEAPLVRAACLFWGWRLEAFEGVPGASGEAYDAELAGLFTPSAPAKPLGESDFRRFAKDGWVPTPEAAFTLATQGHASLHRELMTRIAAQPDQLPYANALAALEAAGTRGASELLADLDLDRASGGLSLAADDASRGGLTEAVGARGGLSHVSEDPQSE